MSDQNKLTQTTATTTIKRLVIGLDFGAAFTKVVIGDNRVQYAVPFGWFAHPENQYLLPSILAIDKNQHCSLTPASSASCTERNLKIPLFDGSYTDDDLLRVTAYLALVFRSSRGWLQERYQKRYQQGNISWEINAGLPTNNTKDSQLSLLYKKLIHSAWIISVLPGSVTLNRIRQYITADASALARFPAVYKAKFIKKSAINTFPACAAQICGYLHSKDCHDDLHMLIDVGAATLNVATFKVANGYENKCELYACATESFGVHYLLKRRYENLKLAADEINLFKHIANAKLFSKTHNLTEKEIKFADTLYSGDAARLINRIMDETKAQYCPDSTCWESAIPTFAYGGGARLEIMKNIIQSLQNKATPHKIKAIKLSPPADLMAENLPYDSYDRLSMAYGLSFTAAEISKTIKKQPRLMTQRMAND